MGTKEVMIVVVLLMAIFFNSRGTAFLGPLGLTTMPDFVHLEYKNVEPNGEVKHLSNNENGKTVIAHHERKLLRAFGSRGINGGQPAGNAGGDNGHGGSNSPYTQGQGGAGVVPLYAAGAGANIHRNNHHSAASCVQSCRKSPALATILLAYLLRNMYMFE